MLRDVAVLTPLIGAPLLYAGKISAGFCIKCLSLLELHGGCFFLLLVLNSVPLLVYNNNYTGNSILLL